MPEPMQTTIDGREVTLAASMNHRPLTEAQAAIVRCARYQDGITALDAGTILSGVVGAGNYNRACAAGRAAIRRLARRGLLVGAGRAGRYKVWRCR